MLSDLYQSNYPRKQAAAEGRALVTMGALPAGTDLYKAVVDLQTNQVLGFYNTETHKLVFLSNKAFSPLARFTLSHELTHALQDQNFGLGRLDRLSRACRADRAEAFRDLVEGDAVLSQFQWARLNLSSQEKAQLQQELSSFPPPPASVPQFVKADFAFPYDAGPTFVQALLARGGLRALNDALRSPPASTEQILHPDKFPKDRPQVVVVPDVSSKLGKGWKAIDFADVGEGFLVDMLQLEVSSTDARQAAAGWDGGQYRAFGKGAHTGVVLMTVWDTERDAREFSDTMGRFVGTRPAKVIRTGTSVHVLFGSDKATLRLLQSEVG
jgi:hypothetical protein